MYQTTDTLYVGNILEAERPPAHIEAVLLVAEEFTPNAPAGVIYERIPLKEFGEAKPASLNQAIDWIARHHPDKHVMVCCRAGMGRSVSVVMTYLCCIQKMEYPDVFQLIMSGQGPFRFPTSKQPLSRSMNSDKPGAARSPLRSAHCLFPQPMA
jgi:protein-tyrosine phosphatase